MKTKIIRDFRLVAFFLILIPAATLPAKSVILPVEAIEDSADLSAGDFESMYPGIDVSGYIPDEEGYYIRYSHENLTYFFGPIDEFGEAVLWKDKLEVIRTDVISMRLTLQKSEISIYHFNHEMLMAAKEEMERRKQGAEGSQSGVAGGTEEASQSGQGEEGEYIIMSQDSGQQGQDSGLFGQTTEQLGEMGEQQGQQGQESQRGQQGQEIQIGQMGQDGEPTRPAGPTRPTRCTAAEPAEGFSISPDRPAESTGANRVVKVSSPPVAVVAARRVAAVVKAAAARAVDLPRPVAANRAGVRTGGSLFGLSSAGASPNIPQTFCYEDGSRRISKPFLAQRLQRVSTHCSRLAGTTEMH